MLVTSGSPVKGASATVRQDAGSGTTCSDIFLLPPDLSLPDPRVPFPSYGGLLLDPPEIVRHVSGKTQLSKVNAGYMDALSNGLGAFSLPGAWEQTKELAGFPQQSEP